MLAALFYWPLKAYGADVGLSFNCLHIALLYVAVVLAASAARTGGGVEHDHFGHRLAAALVRQQGPYGTFHSYLWFIGHDVPCDQVPHCGGVLLRTCGDTESGLRAGLALWLSRLGPQAAVGEPCWPIGSCLSSRRLSFILHPAYYWFRVRAVPAMLIGPKLLMHSYWLPLKHLAAFWIDPDIGILTTWPLGLPLVITSMAMLVHRRIAAADTIRGLLPACRVRVGVELRPALDRFRRRRHGRCLALFYLAHFPFLSGVVPGGSEFGFEQFMPTRSLSKAPARSASIPTRSTARECEMPAHQPNAQRRRQPARTGASRWFDPRRAA